MKLCAHGERFWAVANENQTISKFFHANREARELNLLVFRVRIPCWLRNLQGIEQPGLLYNFYFSPERDFLQNTSLFDLMHTLKTTYDPLQVRLCNFRYQVMICEGTIHDLSSL